MFRRKGFTLIELPVVMAILMPALQGVRKQAREVVCQANLKQWGMVWLMSTGENSGRFLDYLGSNWM